MSIKEWPANNIEQRDVKTLIPYARNARTHSDEQVSQIAASIEEWGWTTPVLIDPDNVIIAGHGRIMAAQRLGFEQVPCMVADGWTEAQKKAYIIADNKLALNAGWDNELLAVEFGELKELDYDLELTGFGLDEIGEFIDEPELAKVQKDLSGEPETYEVVVECADENGQEEAYNLLQKGGFQCRLSTY